MKQNKLKTKLLKWYNSSHSKKFIDFSIKLWKINGYFYMPSSLAFYFIISLVPISSILFMLLSYFSRNFADSIIAFLESFTIFSNSNIQQILEYLKSINTSDYIALITSIIGSLYVASRAIECFSRFADRFYGKETLNHHFFKRKGRSMLLTLLFALFTSVICINFVLLSPFFEKIFGYGIGKTIQYFAGLFILFIGILFFYKVSPTQKEKLINLIPGALFSAIGISLTLFFYGIYLSYSIGHFSEIYGPLTSLIIILFVSLFSSYIFITGFYLIILLNEIKEKKAKEKKEKEKKEQQKKKLSIIIIKNTSTSKKTK